MTGQIREKKLLYKIQSQRDADAFGELYDMYIERIYRFILFKVSHEQIAEDLTSDVFLKTWNYLIDDLNTSVRSFSGLVYRIARNRVVDHYRDRAKYQEYDLDRAAHVPSAHTPDALVENVHDVERALGHIKSLKQEYQDIIVLRFIEELSITEIADILEKKKTNVRVTLHRALTVLKRMMGEE